MHDEEPDHSHHFLHRAMRVIEEGPVLMKRPIRKRTCRPADGILSESTLPSISIGTSKPCQWTAVISGKRFSKMTRTLSPLIHLDGRSGHASVEAPGIDERPGTQFGRPAPRPGGTPWRHHDFPR